MSGKLLVVHDSRTIRCLVRRRILAEGADFVIDEASDAAEASLRLCQDRFDVVVCAETLVDASGDEIVQMFKRASCESKVGFVFILSPLTAESRKMQLERQGVRGFVRTPVEGPALVSAVGTVFEPRARRQHRRVNIPGARSVLHIGRSLVETEIVNVSVSGILCDFALPEQPAALFGITPVQVAFPEALGAERIDDLRAVALRLQVLTRGAGQKAERVRCALMFVQVTEASKEILARVLARADIENGCELVSPSGVPSSQRDCASNR